MGLKEEVTLLADEKYSDRLDKIVISSRYGANCADLHGVLFRKGNPAFYSGNFIRGTKPLKRNIRLTEKSATGKFAS